MGIANEDETRLNVTGYVRVTNTSGEVYDNAQTRLVVGKINLVEKIADLARPPPSTQPGRSRDAAGECGRRAEHSKAANMPRNLRQTRTSLHQPMRRQSAKQVVKEGLSEYFLFTIEGREDIKDKEPKRLVA